MDDASLRARIRRMPCRRLGLGKTLQTLTLLQQIYHTDSKKSNPAEGDEYVNLPQDSVIGAKQECNFILKKASHTSDEMGQFNLFDDLTVENSSQVV